ncbi:MAG TPA: site-specific integrase [Burkholderiales bacterium]|nr:site-specific integrase [Burkholderiales bacterium]
MNDTTVGPAVTSRTARQITVGEVIDAVMAQYSGRDGTLPSRLHWWKARLGARDFVTLDPDTIDQAMHALAEEDATYYAGKTRDGRPIFRSRGKRSGATINRYKAAFASVIKFARRKRIVPRGWTSPLVGIEREPESAGKLRYLSPDEYKRLLAAAKVSRWPMLYILIKLAVESGARKGALMGLRWGDVDLDGGRAMIERTKNGTPFVITILPDTVAEPRRFARGARNVAHPPERLVFAAARNPAKPHNFGSAFDFALAGARIEGTTFHTLRHTHASWLARQGASLLQIAESMNHRTLSMVRRYAHLAVDDRARLLQRVFGG